MAEEELKEYLNEKFGQVGEILKSHESEISKLKKEKPEELPWYLAKNPKQMKEQLEIQGMLGLKEEAGLQDNFDNVGRMFTEMNFRGDLQEGLTNERGQPASLMELYRTMDLRGVLWNYGLGWISALKGGWNIETAAGEKRAQAFIDELREERCKVARMNPNDVAEFIEAQNKMTYKNEIKDIDLRYQIDKAKKDIYDFYYPKKSPKNKKYSIVTYNRATGKPHVKTVNVPSDSVGTRYIEIDKPEEVQLGQHVKSTEKAFKEYIERRVIV